MEEEGLVSLLMHNGSLIRFCLLVIIQKACVTHILLLLILMAFSHWLSFECELCVVTTRPIPPGAPVTWRTAPAMCCTRICTASSEGV